MKCTNCFCILRRILFCGNVAVLVWLLVDVRRERWGRCASCSQWWVMSRWNHYFARGSNGLYCFCRSFLSVSTITHEPLDAAWWNFAWTFLTTARTLLNFKVNGRCHFSLVDQNSPNCFHRTWKKIVVHNAVFRLSIAWSVPEIFAIKL